MSDVDPPAPSVPDPASGSPASSPPGRTPKRGPGRRVVVAGAAALAVGGATTAVALLGGDDDADAARQAAATIASSWAAGEFGTITDRVGVVAGTAPVPADLGAEYGRLVGGLSTVAPAVDVASVEESGDGFAAELAISYDLTRLGAADGASFAYRSTVALRRQDDRMVLVWGPQVVHPALATSAPNPGRVLQVQRDQPERAEILDRDGEAVVTAREVVTVGVQPSRTTDVAATSRALADLLDLDAAALQTRIAQASPDAFVQIITLRRNDYDGSRDQLQAIPGAVFRTTTLPLAPTREFARALLGTVGEATADVISESAGRYASGDLAGLSGLQATYDERLAGRAGLLILAVGSDAVAADGTGSTGENGTATSVELFRVAAVAGQPVRTTLDPVLQQAADETLAGVAGSSALVVVDTADGSVLAVSNGPADGGDRALTGRYAPGSTFKVVTTLGLLAGGFDPAATVSCPATFEVSGRSFRNFEGEALGDVPFSVDFAKSCNTAFASLAPRLQPETLRDTAASLGLGVDWATGVEAFSGEVPVTESEVDRAAASFGQGRNLASPMAMAVVAASVAARARRSPQIVVDPEPAPVETADVQPSAEDLATVAGLMREVVQSGTATVLRDVPGAEVFAKTGTAEYGTGSPPPTHAWTIGWRGSLAFAVLVEDGASGGGVAAPVARDLLLRVAAVRG